MILKIRLQHLETIEIHVNSKNDLCNLEIVKVRNFISNELLYDNAAKMNISVLSVPDLHPCAHLKRARAWQIFADNLN